MLSLRVALFFISCIKLNINFVICKIYVRMITMSLKILNKNNNLLILVIRNIGSKQYE